MPDLSTPAPPHPNGPSGDWWRDAVVYQIYPRSFADGDGDGIGDLKGVLQHVDHLRDLGVGAVWFSPFYPSALADGGYDVDDYRDIDPVIGTLEEFDEVIRRLHALDIKVIIDIVPNHSSDRHVWFREALAAGRGSRERERFLFREGRGEHGELPPSDWQSFFGGSAWQRVDDGQWYLHLFTPEQPDWNWSNPEVRADFLRTLKFWGDRGVDGFRVDVAMGLTKDMSEPLPTWDEITPGFAPMLGGPARPEGYAFADGQNPLFDRDDVQDVYAEWRELFDTYDPPLFAVAEAWVEPHRRARYASQRSLGQAFNFDLLQAPWQASTFRETIGRNLRLAAESRSSSTWVFSNHDVVRPPTRYAPQDVAPGTAATIGLNRSRAATMLALALPGSTYLYQGEELGLAEVTDLPREVWQDPVALSGDLEGAAFGGRDGCRVPLPWVAEASFFGFSEHAAHLPQPAWFATFAPDVEAKDPTSTLSTFRRALALRREFHAATDVDWLDLGEDVVAYRRGTDVISVTNFGAAPVALPAGRLLLASGPVEDGKLPADTTAWLAPA